MSITQGTRTAEWFATRVRGNTSSRRPHRHAGVGSRLLLEETRLNTQTAFQTGISVGHMEYQNGDIPDGNAIVRNNIGCYPTAGHQSTLVLVIAPNSTVAGNLAYSGAAGATGPCEP